MKISKRMEEMETSSIRGLIPYANKAKEEGNKVYHLNIGQPDVKTPNEFIKAISNYKSEVIDYAKSNGIDELILAIKGYYEEYEMFYDKNEILITNGGSEALLFSILSICDAEENILVFEPYYTNYNNIAHVANVKFKSVKTELEKGFALPSKEEILTYIDKNTKGILISNPSNPTGYVYTKEDLVLLSQIAIENNLWIISDEVYREFVYDQDNKYISFGTMKDVADRVILVDSISKRFSACGARIGCIISKNEDILSSVLKLCQSRLSVATLEQVGAAALYNIDKRYLLEVNEEYKKRRDCLVEQLSKIEGVKFSIPKGAFYIMVELPVDNAEKFSIWMLEKFKINKETVMLCPANGFYNSREKGKKQVRLAYVLKEEDLIKSIYIIKEGLKQYKYTYQC